MKEKNVVFEIVKLYERIHKVKSYIERAFIPYLGEDIKNTCFEGFLLLQQFKECCPDIWNKEWNYFSEMSFNFSAAGEKKGTFYFLM